MSNDHGQKRSRLTQVGYAILIALIMLGVLSVVSPGSTVRAASTDDAVPVVTITSPTDGTVFTTVPATIPITASVLAVSSSYATSIAKVEFYAIHTDIVFLIGSDTTAPYSVTWNNVSAGDYELHAVATTIAGNSGTAKPVHIVVGNSTSYSSCSVSYTVNFWATGFVMNFTLKNTGTVPLSNWYVIIIFHNGEQITQGWNASFSQSGSQVIITPPFGAPSIPPGGSVSFGLVGTYSGTWTPPTILSSCKVLNAA